MEGSYAPHGTNASPLTPPTPTNTSQTPTKRLSTHLNTPQEVMLIHFSLAFPHLSPYIDLTIGFYAIQSGETTQPCNGPGFMPRME
jgi:hypothetical protein